jgi:hypothetical protein
MIIITQCVRVLLNTFGFWNDIVGMPPLGPGFNVLACPVSTSMSILASMLLFSCSLSINY